MRREQLRAYISDSDQKLVTYESERLRRYVAHETAGVKSSPVWGVGACEVSVGRPAVHRCWAGLPTQQTAGAHP